MRAISSKGSHRLWLLICTMVMRQTALVAVVRLEHHDQHWEVQINGRHSPLRQEAPERGRKQAEMRRCFLK